MITRLFLVCLISCFAQGLLAIEAAVTYAAFQSPEQAYLELYLRISSAGITFISLPDSNLQARAEIEIHFLRDDQEIHADHFTLSSPPDTQPVDFIALQRYALPPGTYDLRLKLQDEADPENAKLYRATVELPFVTDQLAQSDIQLLASLYETDQHGLLIRNGMFMEPLPYRYYGPDAQRLYFYHELYHTDQYIGQDFVLSYSIEAIRNGHSEVVLQRHTRQSPAEIIPLYGQMDISQLTSGLYQLAIEIRDPNKQLLSRKTAFFQRSNPGLWKDQSWLAAFDPGLLFVGKLSDDSLHYCLRALNPVLPQGDMETINWILKNKDRKSMQAYLYNYWSGQGPEDPEESYRNYMQIARAVDRQFNSGFRYGFETDRGYIYLKYGRPTEIEGRENEPSAPPYEIWTYDELPATRQNNVRFVFYNPSLAPGDYRLLHSTARGELQRPDWQRILYKNAPNEWNGKDFLEGTEVIDNFHRSSRRIFGEN
ncbi:MAG: GWxTD domain-containing protein [Lewinella sp.]|nr:GWxTD domain-containing protein [Lewinella sp.]